MPSDHDTPMQDPLLPRVMSWLHGHGPTPDATHPSRPAFAAIDALRREHALALETITRRTPPPPPTLPDVVREADLDPSWVDLRHGDVVRQVDGVSYRVVAFDDATDSLVGWVDDDPARAVRWPSARCGDDPALCALLRAGRAARYPWVYPDHAEG